MPSVRELSQMVLKRSMSDNLLELSLQSIASTRIIIMYLYMNTEGYFGTRETRGRAKLWSVVLFLFLFLVTEIRVIDFKDECNKRAS